MDPRAMIRFRHMDAVIEPKPDRPATVAERPQGGRISLFYGSTFKQGGAPADAIVVDPRAAEHSDARKLADYIGAPIDEPCCFHGSMMSETHPGDSTVRKFPSKFPIEPHEQLREQAEDLLLAFHRAWGRLSWLLPAQRAFVLNALWWELRLDPIRELALTLLVYDGMRPAELAALTWATPDATLLPRTRGLLARLRRGRAIVADAPIFAPDIEQVLAQVWAELCRLGLRKKPRVHLPDWARVPT
jgi:integrase